MSTQLATIRTILVSFHGILYCYDIPRYIVTSVILVSSLMRSLSFDAAKLLVQVFISTRLDYCNSLMYGISDNLNRRLQAVQNAAARLITSTRRCEHITPVLQQLHWLPVRQRVHFKLAVLAYKALHDRLPCYLAEDCQLVADTGRRRLRSSHIDTCQVR